MPYNTQVQAKVFIMFRLQDKKRGYLLLFVLQLRPSEASLVKTNRFDTLESIYNATKSVREGT